MSCRSAAAGGANHDERLHILDGRLRTVDAVVGAQAAVVGGDHQRIVGPQRGEKPPERPIHHPQRIEIAVAPPPMIVTGQVGGDQVAVDDGMTGLGHQVDEPVDNDAVDVGVVAVVEQHPGRHGTSVDGGVHRGP